MSQRATARAVAANFERGLAGRHPVGSAAPVDATSLLRPVRDAVLRRAGRLTPAARTEVIERRIVLAGLQGTWPIERVLTAKVVLAAFGALLGALWLAAGASPLTVLLAGAATAGGWYVPDAILRGRADERRAALRAELPDVVDRLCIMVEAGLGLERALTRTARAGDGPLCTELARTMQDVHLGTRRGDALQALADRTDLADLRRVVGSLRQAEQFGVPVAQVLRSEASALRDRQQQLAEELAAKLPVKVLFPLIFCILPALLLVVLGPAALDLAGGFGG
jgi:tight adherence protein C